MWEVGAPLHIHPWCACTLGHTHLLPTSAHRSPRPQHDATPGLCRPRSWLRGSHACSLGTVLGRPLGPSEAEPVPRAGSGHPGGQDGVSGQWGSLAVCLGAGPGGGRGQGSRGNLTPRVLGGHVSVLPDGFLELGRVSPPPFSPQCPLPPRGQRLPCSSRLPPLGAGSPTEKQGSLLP